MALRSPRIVSLEAAPPPARALILRFTIQSDYSGSISAVEGHFNVVHGGRIVGRDLTAHMMQPAASGVFRFGEGHLIGLDLVFPLSAATIAALEEKRNGDLSLQFRGYVEYSIAHSAQGGGHAYLGERRRWAFVNDVGGPVEHTVAQSDWLKLLKDLEWSEIELLEVPREGILDPRFARSSRLLQEASRALRQNEADVCMFKCRKAFEAAAQDASGETALKDAMKKLLALVAPEKAQALDKLLLDLGAFTHLARHEQPKEMHFTRSEAVLCLHMTGAAIRYLSTL